MPKTGSTSIQEWLRRNADRLREAGTSVLVARLEDDRGRGALRLTQYEAGLAMAMIHRGYHLSGESFERLRCPPMLEEGIAEALVEQVDAMAIRHGTVVLSTEALHLSFFGGRDERLLAGLDHLAGRHRVRVAYYVRPQDTALESHWSQYGFLGDLGPARFFAVMSNHLHYFDTWASVSRIAPSISFEPRPFRSDLLDLGDAATDFAGRFLGVSDPPSEAHPVWENPGLPLGLVNALHAASRHRLASEGSTIHSLKRVFAGLEVPESDSTRESRRLLRAYCRETFEPDNRRLAEAMGWKTDAFVAADPSGREGDTDLAAIDALYRPSASSAELETLYRAVEYAISSESGPRVKSLESELAKHRSALSKADERARRARKAPRRDAAKAERRRHEVEAELHSLRSSRWHRLGDAVNRRLATRARAAARALRAGRR